MKKGPNDMVRGLFLSLNIGTYILPTCGPLCTFLGPFGGAQIIEKNWVVSYYSYKNGPNDLVRGLF
jgi:hypothetical protein